MGLDVYVGTLTRYYSNDWETVWARRAREAGAEAMVARGGRRVEKGDPETVGRAVRAWRDALNEALSEPLGGERLDWYESEAAPYFTDKPDWDGYAALMLHAAYAMRPELERPTHLPDDWQKDPAYEASTGAGLNGSPCAYIMGPELWLPGDFGFVFQFPEPAGGEVLVGSVDLLLANLNGLNERTFGTDPETAARWLAGEVEAEDPFEAHARHGFAILLYLAEQAVANSLPMKLDY